ncbi:hypothetical protein EV421DRAFT_1910686 [Armillaria borealis]|uniref:Uncharacterized protein n=1 Tax=Armillaria borealis TaxID=47425 RepID=A0AA39MF99_9AGAR|nr:hypothetical protein EV421DRAFT_1910686 [Armillaria borealis]
MSAVRTLFFTLSASDMFILVLVMVMAVCCSALCIEPLIPEVFNASSVLLIHSPVSSLSTSRVVHGTLSPFTSAYNLDHVFHCSNLTSVRKRSSVNYLFAYAFSFWFSVPFHPLCPMLSCYGVLRYGKILAVVPLLRSVRSLCPVFLIYAPDLYISYRSPNIWAWIVWSTYMLEI